MSRFFICILFPLFFTEFLSAQPKQDSIHPAQDSLRHLQDTVLRSQPDTNFLKLDSVSKRPENFGTWHITINDDFFEHDFNPEILKRHPYFGFRSDSITLVSDKKKFIGKELLFYTLIALLLVFAFLKKLSSKYFTDLFRLFFRTTLKQRQIREQLMQSPLPSFLFNGFFVMTASLYVGFLFQHFHFTSVENLWQLFLYCGIGISGIYLIKFLGLKLSGWIFNAEEATNAYIFIVFIVNKMIGIFLLPFLILLAFTQGAIYEISLVLSWCGIGALYIYRFILSYGAVRNQVKLNPFHFFLYVCAFEIAPLLLIYKALLYFFSRTA